MRKVVVAAAALALLPFVAVAQEGPTDEQMAKIDEVLKAKSCEVDPANVEVDDEGLDHDDGPARVVRGARSSLRHDPGA